MKLDTIYNMNGKKFFATKTDDHASIFVFVNGTPTLVEGVQLPIENGDLSNDINVHDVEIFLTRTMGSSPEKQSGKCKKNCAGKCKSKQSPTVELVNGKPRFVEVVRYIRPEPTVYEDSNMYGVTLVFKLDYRDRKVDVGISICNGDNFDKEIGVSLAKMGGITVKNLNMPANFDAHEGITHWFINGVPVEASLGMHPDAEFYLSKQDIDLILMNYSLSFGGM